MFQGNTFKCPPSPSLTAHSHLIHTQIPHSSSSSGGQPVTNSNHTPPNNGHHWCYYMAALIHIYKHPCINKDIWKRTLMMSQRYMQYSEIIVQIQRYNFHHEKEWLLFLNEASSCNLSYDNLCPYVYLSAAFLIKQIFTHLL